MITVGTICYLTGGHTRAGECCTVIRSLSFEFVELPDGRIRRLYCYDIELPHEPPENGDIWVAEPHELIPIAPPGLTEREDRGEPVECRIGDLG